MAEIDDKIKELQDYVKTLEDMLRGVTNSGDKFVEKIQSATRQSLNLNNVFEEILDTSKDLPDEILNVEDIQKRMVKDAKFFHKIQEDTFDLTQKALNESWEKILQHLKDINATDDQITEAREKQDEIEMRITNNFQKEFMLMKRQKEEAEAIKASFVDIAKVMDDLESAIRHPSKAIDGMFAGMSKMPDKFMEIYEKTGSFKKGLVESVPPLKSIVGFFKFLGKAGVIVGGIAIAFVAVLAPIILAWKALKVFWDFMEKVTKSTAEMNKELGASGSNMKQLRGQMASTGVQFEFLGKSFEEGAKAVTDLASAMMTVQLPPETLKTTLKLSEYVGLGAEQAGKLALQFEKSEGNLNNLNNTMSQATKIANEYGVPVNQVRRDIGENIDILQRFGTQNSMVMAKSAAKARSYGLTIKEVNAAFGKQLDTFEGSSDAAAKLNTIFGSHINSYRLMMETNPMKRMEMLRGELVKQGKTWDKLSVFEKNVITQTMGVNEEQAALVLSSDKVRRKLQAQAQERARQNRIDNDWQKGLSNVKETMLALQPAIDRIMRAIAQFAVKLITGKDAGDQMTKTADIMASALNSVAEYVENLSKEIDLVKLSWLEMTNMIDARAAEKALEKIDTVAIAVGEDLDKAAAAAGGFSDNLGNEIAKSLKKMDPEALFEMNKMLKDGSESAEIFSKRLQVIHGLSEEAAKELIGMIEYQAEQTPQFQQETADRAAAELRKKQMREMGIQPGGIRRMMDGILTDEGKMISLHPKDNIIATQKEVKVSSIGTRAGDSMSTSNEIKMLTDAVRSLQKSVSGMKGGNRDEVIQIDLNLDGKKIAEQQVKISRN